MKPTMFELEQYLAGTLAADRRAQVEAAIAADPGLEKWIADRRRAASALEKDPRVKPFSALSAERRAPLRVIAALAAIAAAVALGVILLPERPVTRVRGGVTLRVLVLRGEKTTSATSGVELKANDRIELRVEDPEGGHLAVLLDADGEISEPFDQKELGVMTPPVKTLPGSLELDAQPGPHRLWVALCRGRPDISRWKIAIAEGHNAADGCRVGLFEWRVVP